MSDPVIPWPKDGQHTPTLPSPVLRASEAVDRAVEAARRHDPNAGAYAHTAHRQIQTLNAFVEQLEGELQQIRARFDAVFGEPQDHQPE